MTVSQQTKSTRTPRKTTGHDGVDLAVTALHNKRPGQGGLRDRK